MLNLMDPVELEDLVVFRDDEDPRKFYLLPDQPVIPLDDDGAPDFLFIKYLRDVDDVAEGEDIGGGYVQFRTVLSIAPERHQRVVDALRARLQEEQNAGKRPFGLEITSTEPLLAAPLWTEGTVSMSTFAVGDQGLVRHATETADVDLAGDLGASIRLELPPDGAEIFWTAFQDYENTQIPILITYHLKYKARVSASLEIHAKREVIHRRIWEQARPFRLLRLPFARYVPIEFEGALQPESLLTLRQRFTEPVAAMIERPQIATTVDQTIVSNEITVRIDTDQAGTGDEAAAVQQMLFKVATDVLTDRIVPLLFGGGESLPGAASESAGHADLELVQVTEDGGGGDASFDLQLSQRSAIERPVNPNGPIHLLVDRPELLARCFRELRLTDGFFDLMRVTASTAGVNFERDGIDKIHVWVRYRQNDTVDPAHPLVTYDDDKVLQSATDAIHWRWPTARSAHGGHEEEYEYRTQVHYADGRPAEPPDGIERWTTTTSRVLLITPPVMGALRVEAVLTAPPDHVSSARVAFRYTSPRGSRFDHAVELDHAQPSKSWFQYTGEVASGAVVDLPEYEYRVHFRVGGGELATAWLRTAEQTLEVPSPFSKTLVYVVRPLGSFDGVANLSGDLVYEDSAHDYRAVRSFELSSSTDSVEFRVPAFEDGPEDVTWTARLNRTDGSSILLGPGRGTPGTVWVGAERSEFLSVQIVPDLIDFEHDVELALVHLHYEDPQNALSEQATFTFSRTARSSQTWRVGLKDPARVKFDADIRYIAYDRSKSSELHLREVADQVLVLDRAAPPGP